MPRRARARDRVPTSAASAPDSPRRRTPPSRARDDGQRGDGLALALQLELERLARVEDALGCACRRLVDQHAPWLRGRLQARGQVDRVAEGRVLDPRAGAERAEHDAPGADADAHAQAFDAPRLFDLAPVGAARSSTIRSAARTARSASSSDATGAPKNASTPSPARSLTWPPSASTSRTMRATASPTTSLTSSGSSRSASAVEPTRSAKSAVTTLRSSRIAVGVGLATALVLARRQLAERSSPLVTTSRCAAASGTSRCGDRTSRSRQTARRARRPGTPCNRR